MNFYFCETCGKRITEKDIEAGAGRNKKFAGVFCADCAQGVMTMETLALTDSDVAKMQEQHKVGGAAVPPSSSAHAAAKFKVGAARTAASRTSARHGEETPPDKPATSSGPNMALVGGGVATLGCVLALILMTRGSSAKKPELQKTPPVATAAKAEPSIVKEPVKPEPPREPARASTPTDKLEKKPEPAPAQKPVVPAPPDEDPREGFAARRLAEIKALEQKGGTSAFELRKQYVEFVASYGRTNSGKLAAEKLKMMPEVAEPAPPPPPAKTAAGEATVLFSLNFDNDDDFSYGIGEKDTTCAYGDTGASLRMQPLASNGFFRARGGVNAESYKTPLNVTDDMWIRFAYKLEGGQSICFHVLFDDGLYEKWLGSLPSGDKWHYAAFKFSEFNKTIQGKRKTPAPGARFKQATILCGENKPCTLRIDNFSLGEGPIPKE